MARSRLASHNGSPNSRGCRPRHRSQCYLRLYRYRSCDIGLASIDPILAPRCIGRAPVACRNAASGLGFGAPRCAATAGAGRGRSGGSHGPHGRSWREPPGCITQGIRTGFTCAAPDRYRGVGLARGLPNGLKRGAPRLRRQPTTKSASAEPMRARSRLQRKRSDRAA